MKKSDFVLSGLLLVWSVLVSPAGGDVVLPSLIGDSAVLQQAVKVPIWGTADPGESVTVTFCGQSVSTKANADGSWRVDLKPLKPGGPYEMVVTGKNTLVLEGVLVGQVWIAAGQSNMQMTVAEARDGEREVAAANYPKIRLFAVPPKASPTPVRELAGGWAICTPRAIRKSSAVAYYFARELHKSANVPIGVICAAWGGTSVRTWCPRDTAESLPMLAPRLKELDQGAKNYDQAFKKYVVDFQRWEAASKRGDPGNTGFAKGYARPDFDDSGWNQMDLPTVWEYLEPAMEIDGVVWFRKELQIPTSWVGGDLTLSLGPIDDWDVTYFNGTKVGATGLETPCYWLFPRTYTVPASCVKAGRNVLVVRVFDHIGHGGIYGPPEHLKLFPVARERQRPIWLAGVWKYKIESTLTPVSTNMVKPVSLYEPTLVCGLFNAMIHPLIPYAIEGVIWYQGEADSHNPAPYRTVFPAMITGWRKAWGQGDFPFLFVQLPNYIWPHSTAARQRWAELRDAQLEALKLPKTGMAVTIDVGEAKNLHPLNKQDVGKRLALAARGVACGEKIVYSGPIYKSMAVQGGRIRLSFEHVGSGLVAKTGEALNGFVVAGSDKKFVMAEAKIESDTIVVWSDQVEEPVAVRYAWADNPVCNLYNQDGLPASPFRTDDW